MVDVRTFINGLPDFRKDFSAVRSTDAFATVMTFSISTISDSEKMAIRKQLLAKGLKPEWIATDAQLQDAIRIIGGKLPNDWAKAREE